MFFVLPRVSWTSLASRLATLGRYGDTAMTSVICLQLVWSALYIGLMFGAVLSIETFLKFADHCVQERFGVSEYSRSSSDESDYMASTDERDPPPSTSFVTRRVNASTFLVIEDDVYGEQPYIYVKIYDQYLLLTDTGCNSPRSKEPSLTSLRQFLETYPVSQNKDRCLNPNGIKKYVLICSHCHYDHILGIPQFLSTNPTIIASDFNKSFLLEDLDQHSLCKYVNVPTPEYEIAHWASHMSYFSLSGIPFRIQFLHVPGHTPDSLAFYDLDEHHIYVGDTFYERKRWKPIPELPDDAGQVPGLPATQAAIIFPEEGGNWIQYMASLDMLLSFVMHQNMELRRQHGLRHESPPRVKVGCGHLTYEGDAETMIVEVRGLFERIIAGKIPVSGSGEKRGIIHDFWLENENAKYSVMAPRHLAQEAARHFHPDMTHGP